MLALDLDDAVEEIHTLVSVVFASVAAISEKIPRDDSELNSPTPC
jgi:hypothetical protein